MVLVLSYLWLTPSHPDPAGAYLALLLGKLASIHPRAHQCALFWDYACLPQSPRTAEEEEVYRDAVQQMGSLYASATGTSVIQFLAPPPRPPSHDGMVLISRVLPAASRLPPPATEEDSTRAWLGQLGSVIDISWWQGQAVVRFSTHPEAQRAVDAIGPAPLVERTLHRLIRSASVRAEASRRLSHGGEISRRTRGAVPHETDARMWYNDSCNAATT